MESPFLTIGKAMLIALLVTFFIVSAGPDNLKNPPMIVVSCLLGATLVQLRQLLKLSYRIIG